MITKHLAKLFSACSAAWMMSMCAPNVGYAQVFDIDQIPEIPRTKLDAGTNTSLDDADTALQPSDDVSELNNDAGYVSENAETECSGLESFRGNGTCVEPGTGSGNELLDLTDVTDSTPTTGNALMADGTNWVSRPLTVSDIAGASNSNTSIDARVTVSPSVAISAGVITQITTFDEVWDDGNNFASGTYTAPEAGKYEVIFSPRFNIAVDGDRMILYIRVNGTNKGVGYEQAGGTGQVTPNLSVTVDLAISDTLTFFVQNVDNDDTIVTSATGLFSYVDVRYLGDGVLADDQNAGEVAVDATGFSGNLSATDVDIQTTLETIDALALGGADATTVSDTAEIGLTETGDDITADIVAGSIDETKLDSSTNASLDLADSAIQPGANVSTLTNDTGFITGYTVVESDVTAHEAAMVIAESQISDLAHTMNTDAASKCSGSTTYLDGEDNCDVLISNAAHTGDVTGDTTLTIADDVIDEGNLTGATVTRYNTEVIRLAGQFLLDPNEVNGWGQIGWQDNTNSQDLGDVGATTFNRLTGGLIFPYDVKVKSFFVHHYNSNAAALAWGWVMGTQTKTGGSNTVTTDFILDESSVRSGVNNGAGLRNYLNTTTQETSLDLSSDPNNLVEAGEVLFLGVGAPTAVGTNYYVRVMSGYIEVERVD